MFYTYMLRCEDNSIYTGITTDLKRRFEEHKTKNEKCAKYTKRHQVVSMIAAWETDSRVNASKLEYHIKHLTKIQKEKLVENDALMPNFLGEKIDVKNYERILV